MVHIGSRIGPKWNRSLIFTTKISVPVRSGLFSGSLIHRLRYSAHNQNDKQNVFLRERTIFFLKPIGIKI